MFCQQTLTILAVGVALLFPLKKAEAQPTNAKATPLFNGKNFDGWYKYSSDKKVNAEGLIVMDPFEKHIIIKGTAPGYLITRKSYGNYEMNFEWRWALSREAPAKNPTAIQQRKSGVLFHINSEEDLIWPQSIQAHLDYGRAGDLILVKGFALSLKPERKDPQNARYFLRSHDGVEKPAGDWNQGTITCHGKFVSIKVNDTMVMAGREAETGSGRIALQSEAGEIHFRNITMRPLEGKPVDPEKDD